MKETQTSLVINIQVWLAHLVKDSAADYAEKKNPADRSPQTGQAWRSFPARFGPPTGPVCTSALSALHDFASCAHPLAALVADALNALALELQNDAFAKAKTQNDGQIVEPVSTVQRLCDWLDAAIHFSTHSFWHHARFCFDPDPEKRDLAAMGLTQRYFARQSDYTKAVWHYLHSVWAGQFKDSPKWLTVGQAMLAPEPEPWTYQQLDTVLIYVWPLVKRHNWTYRDLLNVLCPILARPNAYHCQTEQDLAAYASNVLGLHKTGRGATAKNRRPSGCAIVPLLFPPAPVKQAKSPQSFT
jgi:hypothetical protein